MSDRHQLVELLDDLDNGTYGTISGVADRLRDALAEQERTVSLEELAAAAQEYLDAQSEPAYSWVIESRAARAENRTNREVERMDRIAKAGIALRAALAQRDREGTT